MNHIKLFILMEVMMTVLIIGILSILVKPTLTRLLSKAKLTEDLLAMITFKRLI
jgi:Tfp pilus assembly protein PilE